MERLSDVKGKMDRMLIDNPHLKDFDFEVTSTSNSNESINDNFFPPKPAYFRIAKISGIKDDCIYLDKRHLVFQLLFVVMVVLSTQKAHACLMKNMALNHHSQGVLHMDLLEPFVVFAPQKQ